MKLTTQIRSNPYVIHNQVLKSVHSLKLNLQNSNMLNKYLFNTSYLYKYKIELL